MCASGLPRQWVFVWKAFVGSFPCWQLQEFCFHAIFDLCGVDCRYILGTGELSTPQVAQGGQYIRIYGANFGRMDLANSQSVRAWYVSCAITFGCQSRCVPVCA